MRTNDIRTYRLAELVQCLDCNRFSRGFYLYKNYTFLVDRNNPNIEQELILAGQKPNLLYIHITIEQSQVGLDCTNVTWRYLDGTAFSCDYNTLMRDSLEEKFNYTWKVATLNHNWEN